MGSSQDNGLQHEIEIAASPAQVWEVISDVRRMPEWSPQVVSTRLRKGYDEVALGAEFTNLNHHGEAEWTTHGEIVRFEANQQLAFRVPENTTIWSFTLEPVDGGTRLVQRRTTPEELPEPSKAYVESHLGGNEAFTQAINDGMQQTLTGIKATIEGR